MRRFDLTAALILGVLAICCARTAPALGPTPLSFPHSTTFTTDTLYQAWPGTDSLTLEIPFRMWTRTPTPVVSRLIELEWIGFETAGVGPDWKYIDVGTGFRKESLKGPVEYTVTLFDTDRKVVANGKHLANPKDYMPIERRGLVLWLEPILSASIRVPRGNSETLSEVVSGRTYTMRVPTNWATCRIEIQAVPPTTANP